MPRSRTPTPRSRRYCFKSGMAIVRKWNTEAASRIVAPARPPRRNAQRPGAPEATIWAEVVSSPG